MKKNGIFFLILVVAMSVSAQQQTADGGYVITGTTFSYVTGYVSLPDALVYKLDAGGNVDWFQNYGGVMGDSGVRVIQSGDGGYALLILSECYTFPYVNPGVVKLDASGNVIWRTVFPGTDFIMGYDLQLTSDGGYIVAGMKLLGGIPPRGNGPPPVDVFVWKLDSGGATQWSKTYGGSQADIATSVQQTSDGGYIIAGGSDTYTHGQVDFLVYKLNAAGQKQWRKNYGGAWFEVATAVQQTTDGGYILAGSGNTYTHGMEDFLVYKVSASGQKQWRKNFGGFLWEEAYAIAQTSDGGYIIGGDGDSYTNGLCDMLVYKLNAAGQKQWRKNYGGWNCEHYGFIRQTSDGGYMLFGETQSYTHGMGDSDFILYKLNAAGQKQWRENYGGTDDEYTSEGGF